MYNFFSGSLARQIVRGSKTSEIIMSVAKNLAQQEDVMNNTSTNLQKIQIIQSQLGFQLEAIKQGSESLENLKELTESMER
jgi:hypothetical protein